MNRRSNGGRSTIFLSSHRKRIEGKSGGLHGFSGVDDCKFFLGLSHNRNNMKLVFIWISMAVTLVILISPITKPLSLLLLLFRLIGFTGIPCDRVQLLQMVQISCVSCFFF